MLERIRRGGLLDHGSLTLRQRELVILRTCARCGAEYEWGIHVAVFAPQTGMTPAEIAATAQGGADDALWTAEERLILRLADSLHDTAGIDDPLHAELAAAFSPAQLVELVVLAGFYHTISFAVNAFAIEPEPEAARFPARA